MSSNEKDQIGGDVCKNHAARCDKDLYRICPSKLSKRELEDLYYSLLENNLELKRAVNGQNEKIRLLTTKVNRMTAQNKIYTSKEPKDCCAGAKAIITDQKASIADLKKANECMSERIKRLNMRLCTARQFLKKSPSQTINKCYKCFSGASTTVKNQSTSALNARGSNADLKTVALSSIDRETPIAKTVETNTVEWESLIQDLKSEKSCDENKCRSTMEEFKQKIVDLQEELSKSHTEYSQRMSQLEQQVARLQAARAHGDRDREICEVAVNEREKLEIQLSTEKMKVAELETRLKAADMSKEVATTIEKHLYSANQLEEKRPAQSGSKRCVCNVCARPCRTSSTKTQTELPGSSKLPEAFEDRQTVSDDSGYVDNQLENQKDGSISKLNQELLNKIAQLQEQMDYIKLIMVEESADNPNKSIFDSYETVVKDSDVPLLKNVKDYNCVIIDPKSKVIVEIAHVNKDIDHDDEIDSDIEGNCIEKVRTREQGSMKIQSNENIFNGNENAISVFKENSTVNLNATTVQERKNSQPTAGNIRRDFLNEKVTPLEEYECLNQNYHLLDENKEDETENTVTPTPKKQNGDTKTVKCKNNVICKCPKCDDSEPAKNSESSGSRIEPRDIFENKVHQSISQEGLLNRMKTKPDSHNSLQIPGPIPTSKKDSITSRISRASNKLELLKEKENSGIDIVGDAEEKKEVSEQVGKVKDEQISNPVKYGRSVGTTSEIADIENLSTIGKNIPEKEKNVQNKLEKNLDDSKTKLNETIDINKPSTSEQKSADRQDDLEHDDKQVGEQKNNGKDIHFVRECRTVKEEVKRLNEVAIESRACCNPGREGDKIERYFDICARQAVCLCPDRPRCSPTKPCGALAVTADALKQCKCSVVAGFLEPETSTPADKEKVTPHSPANTYTIPSPERRSRATTPDNTECEISFMSDLPSEKEGTSTRSTLSPGEHKMNTTYRESYTPCHWSSLSEGEVPNGPKRTKKLSISLGEHPGDDRSTVNHHFPEPATEKMEAALQAISRELARCRVMLQSQRPREQAPMSKDAAVVADLSPEEPIVLRKTQRNPSISGAISPKCVFILHIGTIVLSDEALINSRDVPLMLTWKFFDQNVAMTRMSPGRVVHFDFSTEYEVNLTEDFVDYMKHVEMPIKICEMDDKAKLFAICTLPLREALLNANRRADLSLEMLAGLEMKRTRDSLDTSDEIGVLDLWCMLRTEPRHFMALQKAIGLNSGLSLPSQRASNVAEASDEAQSYDCGLSQDLDLDVSSANKHRIESNRAYAGENSASDKKSQNGTNYFYVPEPINAPVPPVNVHHVPPRHNKLGAPSVTSNLRMASFDTRQIISSAHSPPVDVTQPGVVLTEVTPKVRSIGEVNNEFERQHDLVYPSYDEFHEKQEKRRLHSSLMDPNYMARGSRPPQKNETCGTNEPSPSVKELKTTRDFMSVESESLSRHRKFRESGGASVKLLKPSKELQSLESETLAPQKKFRDNSTQSMDGIKKVTIAPNHRGERTSRGSSFGSREDRIVEITVLWLALNEECDAMTNPNVRRLYVAYSFLGRDGAELETPISLPKPKYYIEKCFFNFKKTFHLTESDIPVIQHMTMCRSQNRKVHNSKDCIVFTVVSEPPEDPLGLENCEDIGHAYLYLGDLLAYSAGDTFTEVLPVRAAAGDGVCGVLAVRLDGLRGLRELARG